jgi:hypothetical protein
MTDRAAFGMFQLHSVVDFTLNKILQVRISSFHTISTRFVTNTDLESQKSTLSSSLEFYADLFNTN